MEYSEKFLAFAEYLGLDEEDYQDIEEISDVEFECYGDTYKVLDDTELDQEIESQIQYEIDNTKDAINRTDLSNLSLDYFWNMQLVVDESYIRDNVDGNFPDFIGTGTYEEFEGYYIFLMN